MEDRRAGRGDAYYLEAQGLWRNELHRQVVQAILELESLAPTRVPRLEYIQDHLASTAERHAAAASPVGRIGFMSIPDFLAEVRGLERPNVAVNCYGSC